VWRDAMAIGFDTIDDDHKQLFNTINEFEACPDFTHAEAAAKKLYKYTHEHFKREESLQGMLRYPYADAHKDEHEQILAKLMEVIKTHFLKKGSADEQRAAIEKMTVLMHDWIMQHVLKTDVKMKPYLNN
jgi:hemerythrin